MRTTPSIRHRIRGVGNTTGGCKLRYGRDVKTVFIDKGGHAKIGD